MNILTESVSDCKYVAADKSRIDCMVKFSHLNEIVPFTAVANDCEDHGREIFARASGGEFGKVADYVDIPPSPMPKNPLQERIEKLEAALSAAKIPL